MLFFIIRPSEICCHAKVGSFRASRPAKTDVILDLNFHILTTGLSFTTRRPLYHLICPLEILPHPFHWFLLTKFGYAPDPYSLLCRFAASLPLDTPVCDSFNQCSSMRCFPCEHTIRCCTVTSRMSLVAPGALYTTGAHFLPILCNVSLIQIDPPSTPHFLSFKLLKYNQLFSSHMFLPN